MQKAEPGADSGTRLAGAISAGHLNFTKSLLDALPAAIYTTDMAGNLTYYNKAASRLWGHDPEPGASQWCGSWRLYRPDGTPLPHSECPMSIAIRERRPVRGVEAVAERPDGTRVPFLPFPTPLHDAAGRMVGAVNILLDLSEQWRSQAALARRIEQQTALYKFTDKLQRAAALDEVYEAALTAILDALSCQRASILLFDQKGVMRFAAWRGLSDGYRQAVDGHSPWSPDTRDPEPICVDDVSAADIPDQLKQTIRREGIGSLAFIPLVACNRLIGKFMVYYDGPHAFTGAECDLALAIGRQLGFGIQRVRAEAARQAAEESLKRNDELLRLATRTGRIGLWEWDIVRDRVSWTESLYSIHGVDKNAFGATAQSFLELVHPGDRERVEQALRQTLEDDAPYELEFRALKPDGQVIWLYTNASVVRGAGKPIRMVGATLNLTDRKETETALRKKSAQLETILETVPAIIWIAHDPEASHITGSRYAADTLRLSRGDNHSLSAPEIERPRHFRVLKDGRELSASELPIQRASKGEEIRNEEVEVRFADGKTCWQLLNASPIRDSDGTPLGAVGAGIDITERKRSERQQALLINELDHRVKNTLAVVQGIAQQTLKGAEFAQTRQAFEGRLAALAAAHDLLTRSSWEQTSLDDLLTKVVQVSALAKRRVSVSGPHFLLRPKQAVTIAMAMHELCTNALKYGSLSNETGLVSIVWSISGSRLRIVWKERGGPPVLPPEHQGFGSRMIEQALAQELGGKVTMAFDPEGLVCTIDASITNTRT